MFSRGLFAFLALTVATMPGLAGAQTARISMTASSSRVTVGEPFSVEIRADVTGAEVDEIEVPDFGNLEVLGRRMSRPFTFSFGFGNSGQRADVQSQIIHSFTLRATQPGTYTLEPAIIVVGKRRIASQPLRIEVSGSAIPSNLPDPQAAGAAGSRGEQNLTAPPEGPLDGAAYDQDAFVRTVVDKKQLVVGEQVTATVYLYLHGSLSDAPAITQEPTADGFWVQDLLPPNRALAPTRQEISGRAFNVYVLRRFAGFALREGELKIGATSIEIGGRPSLFDLLAGPSSTLRRAGIPVSVEVRPLPERKVTDAPSFVGELALTAEADRSEARVGDAITLRVTAQGRGNLKALSLADPRIEGVEVLPPEVEDQVSIEQDRVGGRHVFRWLLLARKPGRVSIGSFAIDVFDPAVGSYTRVTTPAIPLQITGDEAPAQAQAPSSGAATTASDAPQFGPVRTRSAFLRGREPLHRQAWFWWAVIAGPLLFALSRAGSAVRDRLQNAHAEKRGERAFKSAQAALEAARVAATAGDSHGAHASIANAIKAALEARLDEPVGGLTYPALRQHLIARGMPAPLAERVVSQLEAGESSRFNPLAESRAELDTALERSRGVVRELERFAPTEAR